ncbi:hypothetical protein HM1_2826 [Heliomicrobium modesticaldum Ice1]|uniref:Uncharacterized protein n=1 Tax=Heliobacterium modesticaldum (strain ATCC 51547 / Ice1) TaxID=498761 RepID=B0TCG7_HELMI|nr:hypothetical protein [Heliomicrobium modesticaldum]ABZ85355.1 hypothetical protein HM1_2826 [Heliomicrobium modesticaldum Ice1]
MGILQFIIERREWLSPVRGEGWLLDGLSVKEYRLPDEQPQERKYYMT